MENRNLQWNKRVKVPLILIFSVNTNHESVAYRSFSPSGFEARGARKVTTGINYSYTGPVREPQRPSQAHRQRRHGALRRPSQAWEARWGTSAGVPGPL